MVVINILLSIFLLYCFVMIVKLERRLYDIKTALRLVEDSLVVYRMVKNVSSRHKNSFIFIPEDMRAKLAKDSNEIKESLIGLKGEMIRSLPLVREFRDTADLFSKAMGMTFGILLMVNIPFLMG